MGGGVHRISSFRKGSSDGWSSFPEYRSDPSISRSSSSSSSSISSAAIQRGSSDGFSSFPANRSDSSISGSSSSSSKANSAADAVKGSSSDSLAIPDHKSDSIPIGRFDSSSSKSSSNEIGRTVSVSVEGNLGIPDDSLAIPATNYESDSSISGGFISSSKENSHGIRKELSGRTPPFPDSKNDPKIIPEKSNNSSSSNKEIQLIGFPCGLSVTSSKLQK